MRPLTRSSKSSRRSTNSTGLAALGFQTSCRTVNEDCYALQKFARCAFLTNNALINCARICHGPSVAGLSPRLDRVQQPTHSRMSLNSDLLLIWGSNAVEARSLAGASCRQKQKGIPIVVVDPRYSATARLADKVGPVQPVDPHCPQHDTTSSRKGSRTRRSLRNGRKASMT